MSATDEVQVQVMDVQGTKSKSRNVQQERNINHVTVVWDTEEG